MRPSADRLCRGICAPSKRAQLGALGRLSNCRNGLLIDGNLAGAGSGVFGRNYALPSLVYIRWKTILLLFASSAYVLTAGLTLKIAPKQLS